MRRKKRNNWMGARDRHDTEVELRLEQYIYRYGFDFEEILMNLFEDERRVLSLAPSETYIRKVYWHLVKRMRVVRKRSTQLWAYWIRRVGERLQGWTDEQINHRADWVKRTGKDWSRFRPPRPKKVKKPKPKPDPKSPTADREKLDWLCGGDFL